MKIILGVHPGTRPVQVSKTNKTHLYYCAKCNDNTAEPRNRPPGRKVRCDTCQGPCEPLLVPALPDQHGIWIGGRSECDPESKAGLIAAGFKCVGYCTREADAEVWYVDAVDPYIQGEIEKLIAKTYGGEPVKYPYPDFDVPEDETDAAEEDDEAGNDFDDEEVTE